MSIKEHIDKLVSMEWSESIFGQSKMKADYKRQLSKVIELDTLNNIHHNGKTYFIANQEVMYLSETKGKTHKFIAGSVKTKAKGKGKEKQEYLAVTFDHQFQPFAKLVVDYLLGRFTFFNNKLYDVNNRQAQVLDDFTIQSLYGFKKDNPFILEILQGIHHTLNIQSAKQLEAYKISGRDFIIDLKEHRLYRTNPSPDSSFFKFYDVDFNTAKQSEEKAKKFLEYVIADADSLHNATLQAYYIAQVACGLKSKQNFFISKSGVRTGKGLRHIGLSGIFNKIDIELDLLTKGGFEANNAWGVFAGGEMALATEQGDIVGDKMERVLKIIATEKTHIARSIGGNLGMVNLTSVLCIDTNRTVALSDEMNGRAVLIQYRNRPEEETDLEREKNFEEYWQAFTEMDKSPKIEGVIGFLLVSLEYFQRNGMKFDWRTVEVVNDDDLDDFQIYLINRLSETNFVERDFYVKELYKSTYGTNNNQACQKMRTIGVKSYRKQTTGGRKIPGYKVDNIKRFNKFSGEQKENSNLFDIFERTNPL